MKKFLTLLYLSSLILGTCALSHTQTVYPYNENVKENDEIIYDISAYNSSEIFISDNDPDLYFPEKFDLREYGVISDVKEQGTFGTCWAIAATDSLETQILKNAYEANPDLSEWHLAYFAYNGEKSFISNAENVFNTGGTNTIASAVLSRWVGAVNEEKMAYNSTSSPDLSEKFQCDYQITDVYNVHALTSGHIQYSSDFLKQLIYDQNTVACAYYSRSEYYNQETYSFYCPDSTVGIDHAITLIGWDDDYPKENFSVQPENNGAWLAKNSWGEDWGDNGYCWISYEDVSLCEAGCYFCVPSGTYSENYQYDETGWGTSISPDSKQKSLTGYMANIFVAKNNDPITAVSFYTTEDNAKYEVTIYTGKNLNSRRATPVSGTPSTVTSGEEKYAGYHTIVLDEPVYVGESNPFSVVVKLTNPNSPYTIPTEVSSAVVSTGIFSTQTYLFQPYGNQEQDISYISSDGITWQNKTNNSYTYTYPKYLHLSESLSNIKSIKIGNVCLKAFSSPEKKETNPFDINKDESVDAKDMFLIVKILNGLEDVDYSIDVNQDNSENIIDLILLKENLIQQII